LSTLSVEDDLALVVRCQKGELVAFNELVGRHRQKAFAMIYQMVRNEEDARDIAQEGFVKAWRSIARFRGESAFGTWLHRIMSNVAIDWLRRRTGVSAGEFDDTKGLQEAAAGARTVPQAVLAAPERLSDAEVRERIDEALGRLSSEHRIVIVLREMHGYEYQEIADQCGCSLGTVMSRLFYARKKLQNLLRDVYENL